MISLLDNSNFNQAWFEISKSFKQTNTANPNPQTKLNTLAWAKFPVAPFVRL